MVIWLYGYDMAYDISPCIYLLTWYDDK